MMKLKKVMLLLLTAAMIALGAVLPKITAALVDRKTCNQSGSREMTAISLDVNAEARTLSAVEKIDLLRKGQMIAITEKEAAMTEADINAAVEIAMREYEDAGIFAWFDYEAWNVQPMLCIDPNAPENYAIFWDVTIINKMEPYQTLAVALDDETGKIYSIRYDIYGEYSLDGVWERNMATMDALVHVYLTQLGFLDEQQNVEPRIEYGELDGEVLYGGLFFQNEDDGQSPIEFYVTGTGSFWNYFPE